MRRIGRLVAFAVATTLAGCATIMHGTTQDIGITSSPTGAKVMVDNQEGGTTPFIAKLKRSDAHIVKLTMDGYAPAELTLTKSVSGWVWGNVVFGGVVGLAVDAISGGLYKLSPDQLSATLARQGAQITPVKDGVYVVLVPVADPTWTRVGQLDAAHSSAFGR